MRTGKAKCRYGETREAGCGELPRRFGDSQQDVAYGAVVSTLLGVRKTADSTSWRARVW